MLFALAQSEWDLFAGTLRAGVNPLDVTRAMDEHLRRHVPCAGTGRPRVARVGHSTVRTADLLHALFAETAGMPMSILRQHGAEPRT